MLKLTTFILMLTTSLFAQANCANSVAELKNLMGNDSLSTRWLEKTEKKPLTLALSNNGENLKLLLTTSKGVWATVTGTICKVNAEQYVAQVSNMSWGPEAPGLVKIFKLKTIQMNMPYQTMLKVSAKGMKFTFEAL